MKHTLTLLFVVCSIALSDTYAQEHPDSIYYKGIGCRLVLPKGEWTFREGQDTNNETGFFGDNDYSMLSFSIKEFDLDIPPDDEAFFNGLHEGIEEAGMTIVETEITQLNGYPAFKFVSHFDNQGVSFAIYEYKIIHDKHFYQISVIYPRLGKNPVQKFEELLTTFEFTEE